MIDLISSEKEFLARYNIRPQDLFDARGLAGWYWKSEAKNLGLMFVVGSRCHSGGHRLRSRAGHCIQCDPSKIERTRRHYRKGWVYIASTGNQQIFKVGITESPYEREATLSKSKYGGFSDWEIIATAAVPNMGEIESAIISELSIYRFEGNYNNDGNIRTSSEMLKAPFSIVWKVFTRHALPVVIEPMWTSPIVKKLISNTN